MPGDESATANVDVTQSADLSIDISGSPDPVAPTGTAKFTRSYTS